LSQDFSEAMTSLTDFARDLEKTQPVPVAKQPMRPLAEGLVMPEFEASPPEGRWARTRSVLLTVVLVATCVLSLVVVALFWRGLVRSMPAAGTMSVPVRQMGPTARPKSTRPVVVVKPSPLAAPEPTVVAPGAPAAGAVEPGAPAAGGVEPRRPAAGGVEPGAPAPRAASPGNTSPAARGARGDVDI
jgi:hypothetical protein